MAPKAAIAALPAIFAGVGAATSVASTVMSAMNKPETPGAPILGPGVGGGGSLPAAQGTQLQPFGGVMGAPPPVPQNVPIPNLAQQLGGMAGV